eukprot:gene11799-10402_t
MTNCAAQLNMLGRAEEAEKWLRRATGPLARVPRSDINDAHWGLLQEGGRLGESV